MENDDKRCPSCNWHLEISRDMWGPFYACADCGFTAEDDDELVAGHLGRCHDAVTDDGQGGSRMTQRGEILKESSQGQREMQRNLSAILAQDLPPKLRKRVLPLLNDLAANDLSMALLDLAQLHRSLTAGDAAPHGCTACPSGSKSSTRVRGLIYGEDEASVENVCFGPSPDGTCPRARLGSPVACADRWISAIGWDFRVAADAELCPLTAMGIIRFLSRQESAGGSGGGV